MKQYFPNGHQDEYPLLEKRNQNENKLVLDWLEEKTWEKNDKELFATKVMHEIGELLYQ